METIKQWRCEACGEVRDNDVISVASRTMPFGGGVTVTRNVCYCNDRDRCLDGAQAILDDWEESGGFA